MTKTKAHSQSCNRRSFRTSPEADSFFGGVLEDTLPPWKNARSLRKRCAKPSAIRHDMIKRLENRCVIFFSILKQFVGSSARAVWSSNPVGDQPGPPLLRGCRR